MDFERTRPAHAFEMDAPTMPKKKDGEAALHITLYRNDRRHTARYDVPFRVAHVFSRDGVDQARQDAHRALDMLLDKLFG